MNKPLNPTSKNIIGKNLAALRKAHHLSQNGLAIKLQLIGYDVSRNVVTRIETGKRRVTDIELKILCEIFQISADKLFES